jgi:hypothetical protein
MLCLLLYAFEELLGERMERGQVELVLLGTNVH